MGEPVYFGVRHLSPNGAFQLRKMLDQMRPELVLVEGPCDLNDQMQWLCHPQTQFPVAILTYTRSVPVRTILYPLAVYSPELQAILWAREHGVFCRFMDLPSSVFLGMQDNAEPQVSSTESVYRKLEQLTGEDHDTFWERHFEYTETYHAACNAFGRELRESGPVEEENLLRERHMKRVIQNAIGQGIPAEKIFVVCGAYHVEGIRSCSPMTDREWKNLPHADSTATLMPYSDYRLSSRSGYGAGNQAPAYFALLWNAMNGEGANTVAHTYLVKLADAHRKAGNLVSSAEVIEAVRLATALCRMRSGSYPCLQDLKDAAIATMGHGHYSELAIAFADTEIGTAIGFLPEGVARTSVQEDFYRQLKKLKLERFRISELQKLDLDLREKLTVKTRDAAFLDLNRSFFLHRLRVLGIHFAGVLRSRQENTNWGEYWEMRWTPEVEIEVVEAALLGDTIEGAAAFALKERADQASSIDQAASIFQDAFLCGMSRAAEHALRMLQGLSVDTAALTEVAVTGEKLSLVIRYGDLRRFDPVPVIPLVEQLFLRGLLTLEDACNCDSKAAGAVTEAMDKLNTLQLNHDFLDQNLWEALLARISDRDDLNTKCSGYAMAMLLERGAATEELLAREVSRRLSPGVPADLGAGWFEGLAGKNRYALITRLSLWRQLSDYLDSLDENTFRRALVFLRRAFSEFSPAEKSDIAENLGEIWGVNPQQAAELVMYDMTAPEQDLLADLEEFDFDDI